MRTGGRIQAAIEVLEAMARQHRPAADALSDWGRAHRFAGSGDRAVIGNIVYDVLRKRLSLAAQMQNDTPRHLVLAAARDALAIELDELCAAVDGSRHAPAAITDGERARLAGGLPDDTPDHVRADVPEWLAPSLARRFGDRLVAEGRAMAARAPLDLRVNLLKADRERVLKHLEGFGAEPTPHASTGVRIAHRPGMTRLPNIEADSAHGKGWVEVQDEGSQIAALLSAAGPREQVLDLCAGAGGKTLALGAQMQNTGQIYAYDRDRGQLRPIFERIRRAGLRQVQVMEAGDMAALDELGPRFDLVFVDAPCSGSGTWRRKPDAKWRLKPKALETRLQEQRDVLSRAATLVKPGGRLAYVTCSVLPEENEDQVASFLEAHPDFAIEPAAPLWAKALDSEPDAAAHANGWLQLSPLGHGTDGFFVALLARAPN
ncbi:MAG: RsmB/NOP family class I SAM-dependent RNA methyltransferase [Pseudomonadota bacterium]